MLTQADYTDIGTLLSFAFQPTQRPGRNPEYRRILSRYRVEVDVRTATDAILYGLGIRPLSDGDFGLILGVEAESPLAFRFSDMPNTATREGRLMAGLVMVGLAAYAFPTPADLDEERVRRVPDVEFETWLRQMCERMQVRTAAGEVIPEEGLDAAWRVYTAMPSTLVGDRGRGSGRLSPKCSLYWVRNTLAWLTDQGMARQDTSAREQSWTLTERFRVQVKDMAAERAYEHLAAVARGDAPRFTVAPATDPSGDPSLGADGDGDDTTDPLAGDPT